MLDKERILEIYLNVIELGPELHGVAAAADYHFGKRARDLSLMEALHVASMAPAPVRYARRWSQGVRRRAVDGAALPTSRAFAPQKADHAFTRRVELGGRRSSPAHTESLKSSNDP